MNVTYNHSQYIVPDVTANTYLELLGIRPGDCLFITQSNLQQTIDVKKLAGDGSAPATLPHSEVWSSRRTFKFRNMARVESTEDNRCCLQCWILGGDTAPVRVDKVIDFLGE